MKVLTRKFEEYFKFEQPLIWRNIIALMLMNIATVYSLIFVLPRIKLLSFIFIWWYGLAGGYGTTVGVHRLWTHKTFKAKLPLRIILMLLYTSSGQYSICQWARDHRTHHKFTDTSADPHNASRGFWFSHFGWLLMKRHPEVKEKGKLIDLSDLWEDPVIRFHQKYFVPLLMFLNMFLPSAIVYFVFGETLFDSIIGGYFARCGYVLNSIWLINSAAHLWGYKPYNKFIKAVQNSTTAFFALGEGWHNFHHVFPWDYRIGEHGEGFQFGTYFIDICAWIGLAYDLKAASPSLVKRVMDKAENDPVIEAPYPEEQKNEEVKTK